MAGDSVNEPRAVDVLADEIDAADHVIDLNDPVRADLMLTVLRRIRAEDPAAFGGGLAELLAALEAAGARR